MEALLYKTILFLSLLPSFSIAQLCTGSLGDPVTGENFGAGSSLV
jgi:hypothetical protein